MDKVIVYYHQQADTMDVWFGDAEQEFSCEEIGGGIILKKDKEGKVLGFEKLYVHESLNQLLPSQPVPFELVVSP